MTSLKEGRKDHHGQENPGIFRNGNRRITSRREVKDQEGNEHLAFRFTNFLRLLAGILVFIVLGFALALTDPEGNRKDPQPAAQTGTETTTTPNQDTEGADTLGADVTGGG